MCLSKVDKELPRCKRGKGWKVFEKTEGGITSEYSYDGNPTLEDNKWYRSTDGVAGGFLLGESYETGFHVYTRKRDAEDHVETFKTWYSLELRKVAYRNVCASGYQKDYRVVVAKNMKILP